MISFIRKSWKILNKIFRLNKIKFNLAKQSLINKILFMKKGDHAKQWNYILTFTLSMCEYEECHDDSLSCLQWCGESPKLHYSDVIMSMMASQITSVLIVYSTICSGQIKENIKAPCHWPLWGEFASDRWPVNSLHKGPVTQKMFPFDDVMGSFMITERL